VKPFLSVNQLLLDVVNAGVDFWLQHWCSPAVVSLNVVDWEEIRLFLPGLDVCSMCLFDIPVIADVSVPAGSFSFD